MRPLLFSPPPEYTPGNSEGREGGGRNGLVVSNGRSRLRCFRLTDRDLAAGGRAVGRHVRAAARGRHAQHEGVLVEHGETEPCGGQQGRSARTQVPVAHARHGRAQARARARPAGKHPPRARRARSWSTSPLRTGSSSGSPSSRRQSWHRASQRATPGSTRTEGAASTDPSATIHADLTPLGFHASVRSSAGIWYVDPYFVKRNPRLYASYYTRYAKNVDGDIRRARAEPRRSASGRLRRGARDRRAAAHVPARTDHRPRLRDLLRRPAERRPRRRSRSSTGSTRSTRTTWPSGSS